MNKKKLNKLIRKTVAKAMADALAGANAPKKKSSINPTVLARSRIKKAQRESLASRASRFAPAKPMPGVVPAGTKTMAMDEVFLESAAWAGQALIEGQLYDGTAFLGYSFLSLLSQRPEYRVVSETIAMEATREWIKLQSSGDAVAKAAGEGGDPDVDEDPDEKKAEAQAKADKIKKIEAEFDRLKVQDAFRKYSEQDGYFGRAHLYLDTGDTDDRGELVQSIGGGNDDVSKSKVNPEKPLLAVRNVEPVWVYPANYDSIDPLKPAWFNPETWFVQNKEVHCSRLLTGVAREVPDLLKPQYAFGGLSTSQMVKPYVDAWLKTKNSVNELISAFAQMILETDLSETLSGGGDQLDLRADLFNNYRDNRNLMMVNKGTEELKNVITPLGTLDALQAQSQEHMCLQAGSLIETARGPVRIEEMTDADRVLTRSGFHPIKWIGVTGHADTLIEIETDDSVLRVTEDHPIWLESTKEFVSAKRVSHSNSLLALRSQENTGRPSLGAVAGGGEPREATTATKKLAACFIASCGKLIGDLSLKVTRFITGTMTGATTNGTIWNPLPVQNICYATDATAPLSSANKAEGVKSVTASLWQLLFAPNTAQGRASNAHITSATSNLLTLDRANAAATVSNRGGNAPRASAPTHACSVPVTRVSAIKVPLQPVYNIEVDGPPEFYANGILVHNCSVSRIPVVKLLGIQPAGLNASSEGEIITFEDMIRSYQKNFYGEPLNRVLWFVQLSLFGEVDPTITVEFQPLRQMTEKERGEIDKSEAEADQIRIDSGVIWPEESRKALAAKEDSRYHDIDVEDVPDLAAEEDEGLEPEGGRPDPKSSGEPDKDEEGGAQDAAIFPFACDAWSESDHPRGQPGNAGQFGSGGGGSSKSPHEGKAGKFAAHGSGSLEKQGFKPRKRGSGSSPTEAAQVAWHVAQKSGEPQTLTVNNQGWVLVKKGEKIPYGHPHMVVDPDGTVTRYKADLGGLEPETGMKTSAPAIQPADAPYKAGIKAFGLEHAEAQKKEWRKAAPKSVDEILKISTENQAAMAAVCEEAAAKVGTGFANPGVKSKKRLDEKIEAGRKPENITDAVRGGFNVDSPEDGDKIIHMLAQKFEIADEGWQKNSAGYFDRKTMVRFPDGQVGEIQMWPPGMLEAKENGGGHHIYEKWRALPEDSPEKGALQQQMVDLYAKVEAALPPSWKSLFRESRES
jgi:hypothetical protein